MNDIPVITQEELAGYWLIAAKECLKRGMIRFAITAFYYGAFKSAPLPTKWPNGQVLTNAKVEP